MICSLCVYILLRSWKSVCMIHFLKKGSSCRSLFYAAWTGNYFGKTSSVYCICISGHQKCLRFNLPPWLECFFTGLSPSLCFLHKGENISMLLCHFYRRVCFPVMELCDITRFHSYIHLFIHLLQNYYESFMYRARETYKKHRMWNQYILMGLARWHHPLDGHMFEQTVEDGDG